MEISVGMFLLVVVENGNNGNFLELFLLLFFFFGSGNGFHGLEFAGKSSISLLNL